MRCLPTGGRLVSFGTKQKSLKSLARVEAMVTKRFYGIFQRDTDVLFRLKYVNVLGNKISTELSYGLQIVDKLFSRYTYRVVLLRFKIKKLPESIFASK